MGGGVIFLLVAHFAAQAQSGPSGASTSCTSLPPACGNELIQNGDFEDITSQVDPALGCLINPDGMELCRWDCRGQGTLKSDGANCFSHCNNQTTIDPRLVNVTCYRPGGTNAGQGPTNPYTIHGAPVNFANVFTDPSVSYFFPHRGISCAGFGYYGHTSFNQTAGFRSYVQQDLTLGTGRPLNAPTGPQDYYVEFWVNLASDSRLALDYVGLGATSSAVSTAQQVIPALFVENSTPLLHAIGWQRVSGVITVPAGSSYDHIIIGNFRPNTSTLNLLSGPGLAQPICNADLGSSAYYYLDDVTVKAMNANAGPGASIACGGPGARLGGCPLSATNGAVSYSWNPASGLNDPTAPNPVATPTFTTVYTLTITINGRSYAGGSSTVSVSSPQAGPSQTLSCPGPARLDVLCANPAVSYFWHTGGPNGPVVAGPLTASASTSPTAAVTLTVPVTTTYTLTATVNGVNLPIGLPRTTTVTINPPSAPLNQDVPCGGKATLAIVNPCPGYTYSWTDIATGIVATGTPLTLTPVAPTTHLAVAATSTVPGLPALALGIVTVTINGGRQCCPLTPRAYTNADGNYNGPGRGTELGQLNVVTTITAADFTASSSSGIPYSGPTFNGTYHVKGALKFERGTFTVMPGTVFYVDGGNVPNDYPDLPNGRCYGHVLGAAANDHFLQIYIGQDARMNVAGATFTAACDQMWGGLELIKNGVLRTSHDGGNDQDTRIDEARVGVLTGTDCRGEKAQYSITGTTFYNDTYGVVVEGNPGKMDPADCQVTECTFYSDHQDRLAPDGGIAHGRRPTDGDYTSAGLVLHGAWHDRLPYRDNSFNNVYVGAEVAGGTDEMRLYNNRFADCVHAAVVVGYGNGPVPGRPGAVIIDNNDISIPELAFPGGQVPTTAREVYGIQVLALPRGGTQLLVGGNVVKGVDGPGNTAKRKIGLDGMLSFDAHGIQDQNRWAGLDIGVRLLDASGGVSQTEEVSDNLFEGNTQGVVLDGGTAAPPAPAISCNTFRDNQEAIAVLSSTVVQISGPDNGLFPAALEPAANKFDGNGVDVDNNVGPLTYYLYQPASGPAEAPAFASMASLTRRLTTGTPCGQRNNGWGVYGMLNRPAAGAVAASDCQDWEKQIAASIGKKEALLMLTLRLIDYREKNGQLSDLETFANTLPFANEEAFDRISIYLMERYRRLGQDGDAQRVHNNLMAQHGADENIANRALYFAVAGHLTGLMPGARPLPADSAALATVAASKADFAPVACATLRYFYPSCSCQDATGNANGMNRPAAAKRAAALHPAVAALRPATVRAYPNPAHDQITLDLAGLPIVGLRLVAAATGQVVLTQAIAAKERPVISLLGLAPGVYQGQLVSANGQTIGACKVVVIH